LKQLNLIIKVHICYIV